MPSKVLCLNGPNLNLLGTREPEIYGTTTLAEIEAACVEKARGHGLSVTFRQTNHEGVLVDWLHEARGQISGIVINPAAWTHTSVALADALVIPEVPIMEVHISNVHTREAFRHHSYVSPLASGVIAGFGVEGYALATRRMGALIGGPKA